jgi:hypothetical protein
MSKLMKLDKMFIAKRSIIIYKIQTRFISSESRDSNTNALPSSLETISSWHVASCKNFLCVALIIVRFVGAGVLLPQRPGHHLTSATFWNLACSNAL